MKPALSTPSAHLPSVGLPADPLAAMLQGLMAMQHLQAQSMLVWQQAFVATNRELWDQWVCHWGGGAPIDV